MKHSSCPHSQGKMLNKQVENSPTSVDQPHLSYGKWLGQRNDSCIILTKITIVTLFIWFIFKGLISMLAFYGRHLFWWCTVILFLHMDSVTCEWIFNAYIRDHVKGFSTFSRKVFHVVVFKKHIAISRIFWRLTQLSIVCLLKTVVYGVDYFVWFQVAHSWLINEQSFSVES